MTVLNILGLCGPASIGIALLVLGLLSKRLSSASHAGHHYRGFYFAAGLLFLSVAGQTANIAFDLASKEELLENWLWIFVYNGLPAIGITIGVVFAWRYWSWLLAERS